MSDPVSLATLGWLQAEAERLTESMPDDLRALYLFIRNALNEVEGIGRVWPFKIASSEPAVYQRYYMIKPDKHVRTKVKQIFNAWTFSRTASPEEPMTGRQFWQDPKFSLDGYYQDYNVNADIVFQLLVDRVRARLRQLNDDARTGNPALGFKQGIVMFQPPQLIAVNRVWLANDTFLVHHAEITLEVRQRGTLQQRPS